MLLIKKMFYCQNKKIYEFEKIILMKKNTSLLHNVIQ
jgi:hypothetical protein